MTKKRLKLSIIALTALLLIFVIPGIALAQDPTPQPTPVPGANAAATPDPLAIGDPIVTFAELGEDDIVLRADVAQRNNVDVRLPDDWIPDENTYLDLDLTYLNRSATGDAQPDDESFVLSSLEITLNGVGIGFIDLNSLPPDGQVRVPVALDPWDVPIGGQTHTFQFRTFPGNTECGDRAEVIIHDTSTLSVGVAEFENLTFDLESYPQFLISDSFLSTRVAIVLPDEPTVQELQTASAIATRLGLFGQDSSAIVAVLDGDFDADEFGNDHLIIIGTSGNNSLIDEVSRTGTSNIPAGAGLIQLAQSPFNSNRAALVVSGTDEGGVTLAATALTTQVQTPVLTGNRIVVTDVVSEPNPQLIADSYTLADIGYSHERREGSSVATIDYLFDIPGGYRVEENSFIDIRFAHSEPMASSSSLSVYLNDVAVGSTELNDENSGDGRLVFALPVGMAVWQTDNELQIRAEMIDLEDCSPETSDGLPWITIFDTSTISVNGVPGTFRPITLDDYPTPFNGSREPGDLQYVLPGSPSNEALTVFLQISAELLPRNGIGETIPDVILPDVYLDEAGPDTKFRVVIGTPSSNTYLATINDELIQKFDVETDELVQTGNRIQAELPANEQLGVIQLLIPETSLETITLVVTGTDDTGLFWAGRSMSDFLELRILLDGNLDFIDDLRVFSYSVGVSARDDFANPESADGEDAESGGAGDDTEQLVFEPAESGSGGLLNSASPIPILPVGIGVIVLVAVALTVIILRRRI